MIENDDHRESETHTQKSHNQTKPQSSIRVGKKPQRFDPSAYVSNHKQKQQNSSSSAHPAQQFDSEIMPLRKTLGADMHSKELTNYEKGIALISHGTNVPK